MYKRKTLVIFLFWTALAIQHRSADAGPMKRLRRIVREVYPPDIEPESDGNQPQVCIVGDVVYGADEPVPAEQPCLKCRCQPPGVQCETIRCTKKPGCKAIHRPNSCCPNYQCECEHNGRTYGNGEKLETDLGGECKVCYCRGGEIQCADVSCYIRKDCEGKRVPGTCCLKYDHCPPIDSVLDGSYTTESAITNNNQQILEVLPLPSISQNGNETFLGQTTNDIQNENKIPDNSFDNIPNQNRVNSSPHSELEDLQKQNDAISEPKITIQEIIPEIKEIPITAAPKSEEASITQGQLIIEEAKAGETSNGNDLVVTDSEPDSSEISEVFQQPPPVLRIGDKLLFLKKGELVPEKDTSTPTSVITIIGAEGLQRGFEESGETHEDSPTNKHKEQKEIEPTLLADTNDLELKTSESSHILSLVKKRNRPDTLTTTTTTEVVTKVREETTSEASTTSTTTTIVPTSLKLLDLTESTTVLSVITSDLPETLTTAESILNHTSTSDVVPTVAEVSTESIKIAEIPEQNPEYPPIPDVMISPGETANNDDTSQRFDNDEKQNATFDNIKDDDVIEMKILPEIITIRGNESIPKNATHNEWLKNDETSTVSPLVFSNESFNQPIETVTETLLDNVTLTTILPDPTSTTKNKEELITENVEITTETIIETTTDKNRSFEAIEDSTEESGEHTTEKTNNSNRTLIKPSENISLENESSELKDMLQEGKEIDEFIESTTRKIANDVEFIGEIQKTDDTIRPINKDVEIINVNDKVETTTLPEELPKPEKIINMSSKTIGKRENPADAEADEVFKQLERELNAENTERIQTAEEEQQEADKIFKELLEETSTPKAQIAPEGRNKDADTLQRVSDALAKLTLKGKQPDSNILGILSNFFSSQYRYRK